MILKKYIQKIIFISLILFVVTLSACEASSFSAIAFTNNGSDIYIDIPESKKYQSILINNISIQKIIDPKIKKTQYYWSAHKHVELAQNSLTTGDNLPIKFGEKEILGLVHEKGFTPKKIDNGQYIIKGEIYIFNEKKKKLKKIYGEFEFKDGAIFNNQTFLTK